MIPKGLTNVQIANRAQFWRLRLEEAPGPTIEDEWREGDRSGVLREDFDDQGGHGVQSSNVLAPGHGQAISCGNDGDRLALQSQVAEQFGKEDARGIVAIIA